MTITTIRRVYFRWYEYEAMLKFEKENPAYKKIAEDTTGTTYEWFESATYPVVGVVERKEHDTDRVDNQP